MCVSERNRESVCERAAHMVMLEQPNQRESAPEREILRESVCERGGSHPWSWWCSRSRKKERALQKERLRERECVREASEIDRDRLSVCEREAGRTHGHVGVAEAAPGVGGRDDIPVLALQRGVALLLAPLPGPLPGSKIAIRHIPTCGPA